MPHATQQNCSIKNTDMPDTIRNNDLLNTAFDDETILSASIHDLKRHLLACTEMIEVDILNQRVKEGLPKREAFIRQLIAMRQAEDSHRSLEIRSKWSIGISLVTLLALIVKTCFDLIAPSSTGALPQTSVGKSLVPLFFDNKSSNIEKKNESVIQKKQQRTDWAESMKIDSKLPVQLENGVIWEDVFHADAIDTLVYSYIGMTNSDLVKDYADKLWNSPEIKEIKDLGFIDIIYLWLNTTTKKEWGVYSSKNKQWYQSMDEYVKNR
jgi:hypothetical protein